MTKYKIMIHRTNYSSIVEEFEANSIEEAEGMANEQAGDFLYSEKSSDYEVEVY